MPTRKPHPVDIELGRRLEAARLASGRSLQALAPAVGVRALSNDHFNVSPDEVHWGHVGTLADYAALLKRITDSAFKEGEHASDRGPGQAQEDASR